jgi:membrane AbrB-like protein
MPQTPASSLKLFRIAESLLIGGTGGFLFNAAKFPAGWLAGSMAFAAVAALAGRQIRLPSPLARVCSVVLGITIGGVVTPETLRGVATWPLSIAMVAISVAAATIATFAYLKRVHGWNTVTAIFASVPGGLAQVMALAAEEGRKCDIRGVAIVQTLRVVILTVVVPAALSLAGRAGAVRLPASPTAVAEAPVDFAILIGASAAVGLGLLRLGFPGGLIFGPLAVSAILHGGAFINVTMPSWLATAAMVGLGTVSGGRFTGMPAAGVSWRRSGRICCLARGHGRNRDWRDPGGAVARRRPDRRLRAGGGRHHDDSRARPQPRSGFRRRPPPRTRLRGFAGAADSGPLLLSVRVEANQERPAHTSGGRQVGRLSPHPLMREICAPQAESLSSRRSNPRSR